MTDDDRITPYDGPTETDRDDNPQPVAKGAAEDDDPEGQAGAELPDEEG
ncbi:MAG TPA: hypothetical protein VG276_06280 [Actinomycetes bacterium]|jgi:hypothetical protein|nr:hypothetical protein [Actinomycetes bacterium]